MSTENAGATPTRTSIAPWLSVRDGQAAVDFYRAAFGAAEAYRLDDEDGRPVVARLEVDGAAFWVQDDPRTVPRRASRTGPADRCG